MQYSKRRKDSSYSFGITISFFLHIILAGCTLVHFEEKKDPIEFAPPEIFSVTLEGGEKLGGILQVPEKENAGPAPLAPLHKIGDEAEKEEQKVEEKSEDKIDEPSIVEQEAEEERKRLEEEQKKKVEEERKRKELEEKKRLEKEKALADAKKKLEDEENKKKAESEKKKKEEEDKKRKADQAIKEKEEREKAIKKALEDAKKRANADSDSEKGAKSNYQGESANAGGTGFGAAKLGGKGMGGGTLASVEFIAYRNALEKHIKSGWHWIASNEKLVAQVVFNIDTQGNITNARITASSGMVAFDESVIRAINKASPVPTPPETVYDQFKSVRITFDSKE